MASSREYATRLQAAMRIARWAQRSAGPRRRAPSGAMQKLTTLLASSEDSSRVTVEATHDHGDWEIRPSGYYETAGGARGAILRGTTRGTENDYAGNFQPVDCRRHFHDQGRRWDGQCPRPNRSGRRGNPASANSGQHSSAIAPQGGCLLRGAPREKPLRFRRHSANRQAFWRLAYSTPSGAPNTPVYKESCANLHRSRFGWPSRAKECQRDGRLTRLGALEDSAALGGCS